jgi:glycosyltransferase involved in cell wall biosynthesis
MHWMILTGEYPPTSGGVSDYTRLVARALAAAGDKVDIWTPSIGDDGPLDPEVRVHYLPDHFGGRGLAELGRRFDESDPHVQLLVQYVPHAFGRKAMNLPFCLWLFRRRRSNHITIMFHEVAFPWVTGGRFFRHNFLAAVNRAMAFLLARSARRLFVSIPGWEKMLRPYAGNQRIEWLPIPSTMPQGGDRDRDRIGTLRRRLLDGRNSKIVGHFGTFGKHIANALRSIIPQLLTGESVPLVILLGRGGVEFAAELERTYPHTAGCLIAPGKLEPEIVSEYLTACDLLIQPYVDGISSRRTSAMAGLACGVPILTTSGALTEPIWSQSGAVCLVDSIHEMPSRAIALLNDEEHLSRLSSAALKLYRDRFHIDRTVSVLRSLPVSLAA